MNIVILVMKDESLANSEIMHSTYTNSILNNLSPFSLKQNSEIKETNKQAPLLSKQANENSTSSKMYSNALKRVVDEDENDDEDSINYHNDAVDMPMEIRKIDDYDGRVKKYYTTETPKTNKSSAASFYSTNETTAGMATAISTTTEDKSVSSSSSSSNSNKPENMNSAYSPSTSTQKSSRKTLKILSN
eukprot:jgi/Orpsp1_1/1182153/evm.model.c7180000080084.1